MTLRTLLSIIDTMSDEMSLIDLTWGHFDKGKGKLVIKDSFGINIDDGEKIKAKLRKYLEIQSKEETFDDTEEMTFFSIKVSDKRVNFVALKACDLNHKRIYFLILPINIVNISMLLEIQFLFQHSMDNTVELCCLLDKRGNIIRMSKKGYLTLELDPDHLKEANLSDYLVSPNNISTIEKLSHRNDNTEIYLKTKSGKELLCLGSIIPIHDCHGEILFYFLTITDISHQIILYSDSIKNNMELSDQNEFLLRTQAVLLKTEKLASIGMLGSGLAHEMNNPLSFLMNDLQLFQEGYDNFIAFTEKITSLGEQSQVEALRKQYEIDYWLSEFPLLLTEMKEGMDRIAKIVHSLKSFSGIERSDVWSYNNLNDALEEMLLISLSEYKYILDVNFIKGDLPLVHCHSKEINQAFLSVFLNSIYAIEELRKKSTKKEKGLITIQTDFLKDSEEVRITFSDNGIPFPLVEKNVMLDPFYTGWTKKGSSGMGLAMVNDIISLKHKGRVDFMSEKGKKVILTLPLSQKIKGE